jgi:hypothetical protein
VGISGADPFDLLIYQQGQVGAPLNAAGATGADNLDTPQRSVVIGEPVPIVFGRRVGNVGGVLISPGATEARFTNGASNAVTATYHLLLSEGQLNGIQVRDVFQRSCRVGTFGQTYNGRAGTWTPGNFITEQVGYDKPEAHYYCGTGGSYAGVSTAFFTITVPDGFDQWNRQVHVFVRGGMHVTRLLDDATGPSNNVVDLVRWLATNTSRLPAQLIDTAGLTAAAEFTDGMGLWFNGEVKEASNLEDFMAARLRYFLLQKTKVGGKLSLRPLLPVDEGNAVDLDPITPSYVFDEARIVPDSFEISFIPLADRRPICAVMLWRQQPDDDIGLVRTTEVRYTGTAPEGPYEQHDLSEFCTSELHAVRVGAYIVASRAWVTHTLRIRVRPSTFNATLKRGDIVQVKLARVASSSVSGEHNYLYEVDRIGKGRSGEVSLDLIHFPVDATGRSLVARDVMAATASGALFSTGKAAAVTCDVNSPTDTSVPPAPDSPNYETPDGLEPGGPGWSGPPNGPAPDTPDAPPPAPPPNPGDPVDPQEPVPQIVITPPPEGPYIGGDLSVTPDPGEGDPGEDTSYQWTKDDVPIPGATDPTYAPGPGDIGGSIGVRVTKNGVTRTAEPIDVGTQTVPGAATVDLYVVYADVTCPWDTCIEYNQTTKIANGVSGGSSGSWTCTTDDIYNGCYGSFPPSCYCSPLGVSEPTPGYPARSCGATSFRSQVKRPDGTFYLTVVAHLLGHGRGGGTPRLVAVKKS